MFDPPFEVVRCSWPRPVGQAHGQWLSDPDWLAPPMPYRPQPYWDTIHGELCWLIDWRDFFRGGLKLWDRGLCGEMRGFHVLFHLRMNRGGRFVFWDDDSCFIRRMEDYQHIITKGIKAINISDTVEKGPFKKVIYILVDKSLVPLWRPALEEKVPGNYEVE